MFREATRADIKRIAQMLADDDIAYARENVTDIAPYEKAFETISADSNNALYVWDEDGVAMGCLQLTFLPGLSWRGSWIAQVEGVRVDSSMRGEGIGEEMMREAEKLARARGCKQLQLMSSNARVDAQRFYARLGFERSHVGMKKAL